MSDLLLLSGGVDSTAAAVLLKPDAALVIDYGQLSAPAEISAASAVARALDMPFDVLRVDCASAGSGLLRGAEPLSIAPSSEWWPYRNQLLVTLAAAWALPHGFNRLFVASVRSDDFHRDGQADFYELLDALLAYQEGEIRVIAPVIDRTTVELCQESGITRSLLGWTFSCHRSSIACGDCPGCNKRRGTFKALHLT